MKRIGLLGGSFDPIHNGHIHMALSSSKEYRLDEVWLIPVGHSPNKEESKMTPGVHRLAMCELVCTIHPVLKTCDIEASSEEKSYTYRTLQKLSVRYPDTAFYYIMGADSADYLEQWKHPEIICALAVILVVEREGIDRERLDNRIAKLQRRYSADIRMVHSPQFDASSTNIRSRISRGESVKGLLPEPVQDYIKKNHLYVTSDGS